MVSFKAGKYWNISLYTFAEMFPKFTGVKQNDSPKEQVKVS